MKIVSSILLIMGFLALSACREPGPAEQAGREIDEAAGSLMDSAEDAAEDAAEEVCEAVDGADC